MGKVKKKNIRYPFWYKNDCICDKKVTEQSITQQVESSDIDSKIINKPTTNDKKPVKIGTIQNLKKNDKGF